MRKIMAVFIIIALFAALFCGCGQKAPSDGLKVVAVNFPPYDFAREIAAGVEGADCEMLLQPGAESHSYDPSPQDIIDIQSCDLFIYGGGESDAWVDGILETLDTDGVTVVRMRDVVELCEEELTEGMQAEEHDQDAEEAEYDEHVWTSPKNAELIAGAISQALCAIDPEHAETYAGNTEAYLKELDALDGELRSIVDTASRRCIVVGDRFPFRYLVEAYGIEYYAAYPGCSTETEASAATIAFLIDKVTSEALPAVFTIEFSNASIAKAICEQTGAKLLTLHSCHNVSKDEFEAGTSYLDLMYKNADALMEALN